MHKKSKSNKVKGWCLIYVVVIFAFISLDVLGIFRILDKRDFYIESYMNTILMEDKIQKSKEYYMTNLNKYMKENLDEIKEKSVEKYFLEFDINEYFESLNYENFEFKENCHINYNNKLKIFELNIQKNHTFRFYPIIEGDKVKYRFVVTN